MIITDIKVIVMKILRYIFGFLIFALIVGEVYAEEEVTYYLSVYDAVLPGQAKIGGERYKDIEFYDRDSDYNDYASAEWTFTLPENFTEITYVSITLQDGSPNGEKVYLNNIYIGKLDWKNAGINTHKFEINESVLERIKHAKTLTLRVETSRDIFFAIYCKESWRGGSYITVKYKTTNNANNGNLVETPISAPIAILASLIIALFILLNKGKIKF